MTQEDNRRAWRGTYDDWMVDMLTDRRLSDLAARIVSWLVFEVDPRCGCLDPITLNDLAQVFGRKHTGPIAAAFDELRDAGYVTFSFPRGHEGWVQVTDFYGGVLYPTALLGHQWADGRRWRGRIDKLRRQEER